MPESTRARILFCHGSRDPAWREPFERLAADHRDRRPGQRVELAFLERMTPTLPEAIAALVEAGVADVEIVSLFLAPGSHTRVDLPAMVEAARARWPKVAFRTGPELLESAAIRSAIVEALEAP